MAPELYAELLRQFPDESLFAEMGAGYNKLSLSERNNSKTYACFCEAIPCWRDFRAYIKSDAFMQNVFLAMKTTARGPFKARFEFSSMLANGGYIAAHRDTAAKVFTLVVPIVAEGQWDQSWGGGTVILKAKHDDLQDYGADWSLFDIVRTLEFGPNQAAMFMKTADSWHGVMPMTGPQEVYRRSLTINIERAGCSFLNQT